MASITLTSILASCLFGLGLNGIIRSTPLGKIDSKPWNCDVCLGFWGAGAFSLGFFSNGFLDVISDPVLSANAIFAVSHIAEYVAVLLSHAIFGAGVGHLVSRAYPIFRPKKTSAPVKEV